jgi:hypoxanthine phosphoribosyltransferase
MELASAWALLRDADVVCPEAEVAAAVARVARELTDRLAARYPLVLTVMGGGLVFAGQLLPQLRFPLDVDYVHATRYRGDTSGGAIVWKVRPEAAVQGRVVVVVDDILDEGKTLVAIREELLRAGAREVLTAVFCEKDLGRDKPIHADFVGVTVPDRYVFGFGMDVRGAWRNLPAVYAVGESN